MKRLLQMVVVGQSREQWKRNRGKLVRRKRSRDRFPKELLGTVLGGTNLKVIVEKRDSRLVRNEE
jgi:hypothetical protein